MTFRIVLAATLSMAMALSTPSQALKPSGGPGVAAVNLNVVIDDSVSMGLFGFGSDGGGTYFNGSSGVQASFLGTGVLNFKTGNRSARAYYSTPVELFLPALTGPTAAPTTFMTFVDGSYLQLMSVGQTRCIGLLATFPVSSTYNRNVGYHAGRGALTNTAYMQVSHPDSNTWILDSHSFGACGAPDNIANIFDAKAKGQPNDIVYGRYSMPLRLLLTRQP
ncbi:MAG TPA: hypothetical protein PKD26_03100 [Pyrinomonadaceae bacterium]|nr:hypothetical protein [Pyrinomonadaceae bacterium]